MGIVHVLSSETINQIAAGEVIERPASIVKELVENAIDSGATMITVEAEQGGISLLRVSDNGSGFHRDDIPTAFMRHATSKIETEQNLLHIQSLGFRGEALSSIAAVAKVELLTFHEEDYLGSRYVIEGGTELSFDNAGCPQGTTIIVRDLFYNVPARRKFLKSPTTEAGYCNELLNRLALAHADISFTFLQNGRTQLHTPGNGSLKDAVYSVYGRETASNLLPVEYEENGIHVHGMIGKPIVVKNNRSFEHCFVNGRDIRSSLLSQAIEEAFRTYVMQHKYPFTVLFIDIDPVSIDVNIHPTKMDVRFSDREAVYNAVLNAIRIALRNSVLISSVNVTEDRQEPKPTPKERPAESFEINRRSVERFVSVPKEPENVPAFRKTSEPSHESGNSQPFVKTSEPSVESCPNAEWNRNREPVNAETDSTIVSEQPIEYLQMTLFQKPVIPKESDAERQIENAVEDEKQAFVNPDRKTEFRILGQLFKTYWIIELENQMLLIDQHAAHEKINYETMVKQLKDGDVYTQQISPPTILTLTIREEEILQSNWDYFQQLGFEIQHFGGRDYAICGVPTVLFGIYPADYFTETLEQLSDISRTEPLLRITEKLASLSCKAAIKGNQEISTEEATHLIEQLLTLENPYHCPHGRPVIISMSKYEIEKKFKRIV